MDISNFNLSKVDDISYMFGGRKLLKEIKFPYLDDNHFINMKYLVSGCLNELKEKIKVKNNIIGKLL